MNGLILIVDGLRALLLIAVVGGITKLVLLWRDAGRAKTGRTIGLAECASDAGPASASPLRQDE